MNKKKQHSVVSLDGSAVPLGSRELDVCVRATFTREVIPKSPFWKVDATVACKRASIVLSCECAEIVDHTPGDFLDGEVTTTVEEVSSSTRGGSAGLPEMLAGITLDVKKGKEKKHTVSVKVLGKIPRLTATRLSPAKVRWTRHLEPGGLKHLEGESEVHATVRESGVRSAAFVASVDPEAWMILDGDGKPVSALLRNALRAFFRAHGSDLPVAQVTKAFAVSVRPARRR